MRLLQFVCKIEDERFDYKTKCLPQKVIFIPDLPIEIVEEWDEVECQFDPSLSDAFIEHVGVHDWGGVVQARARHHRTLQVSVNQWYFQNNSEKSFQFQNQFKIDNFPLLIVKSGFPIFEVPDETKMIRRKNPNW